MVAADDVVHPDLGCQGKRRPLVVMCAFPASGHMEGMLQIAAHLTARGFVVFFLSGDKFEQQARDAGAEPWDNALPLTAEMIKGQYAQPQGHLRWNYQQKHIFLDGAAARHKILTRCLESVRERYPGRQVIIFNEVLFLGALPYLLGAPLPKGYDKLPRIIHFHTSINWAVSDDVAPYGLALPPAKSGRDRSKYRALYDEMRPAAQGTVEYANRLFRSLGATKDLKADFLFSEIIRLPDVVLLACSPSLEYPRSDLPRTIKYIGGMPLKAYGSNFEVPEWWGELRANATLPLDTPERKKVVFLSQGTVNIDNYGELVIPTAKAFAAQQDIVVVATLGKRGEVLPDGTDLPENTRIVDYVPYDAILPLADVFVFNGGYGGFMHGVMNGTPMVFAGTAADKGEVAARAEWAGISVNLRTNTPTQTMIRDAINQILTDRRYKANIMKIKADNEAMDALGAVERQIWELTESQ